MSREFSEAIPTLYANASYSTKRKIEKISAFTTKSHRNGITIYHHKVSTYLESIGPLLTILTAGSVRTLLSLQKT